MGFTLSTPFGPTKIMTVQTNGHTAVVGYQFRIEGGQAEMRFNPNLRVAASQSTIGIGALEVAALEVAQLHLRLVGKTFTVTKTAQTFYFDIN